MKIEILEFSKHKMKIKVNGYGRVSTNISHSTRLVFLFKEFVVKIQRGRFGETQVTNEIKFYNEVLETKDSKFFPKLLDYGYFKQSPYIVQERIAGRSIKAKDFHIKALDTLKRKYRIHDLDKICCGEVIEDWGNLMITNKKGLQR